MALGDPGPLDFHDKKPIQSHGTNGIFTHMNEMVIFYGRISIGNYTSQYMDVVWDIYSLTVLFCTTWELVKDLKIQPTHESPPVSLILVPCKIFSVKTGSQWMRMLPR